MEEKKQGEMPAVQEELGTMKLGAGRGGPLLVGKRGRSLITRYRYGGAVRPSALIQH
jgi:hypothetical protein